MGRPRSSTPRPCSRPLLFTPRFGDGSPIGDDAVATLNAAYGRITGREPWQVGDLRLVDNIRTAHHREPYTGTRSVLVGMVDPVHVGQIAPPLVGVAH